jgi:hypothetical protein
VILEQPELEEVLRLKMLCWNIKGEENTVNSPSIVNNSWFLDVCRGFV